MDSKTYLEASARTASTQFHTEIVDASMLEASLKQAIASGEQLDAVKKSLFYGKALPETHPMQSMRGEDASLQADALNPDFLHAALGLYTEATELLEAILAALQGGDFDQVNVFEECGDAEWYLAMLYRALARTPEEAKRINIDKLKARYPEKFETEQAIERDLEKERKILEQN